MSTPANNEKNPPPNSVLSNDVLTLLDLPFECLGHVLNLLKASELNKLRLICRRLKGLIDTQVGLLFKMDDERDEGKNMILNSFPKLTAKEMTIKSLVTPLPQNFFTNPNVLTSLKVEGNVAPENCEIILSTCTNLNCLSINYQDDTESPVAFIQDCLLNSNSLLSSNLETLNITVIFNQNETKLQAVRSEVLSMLHKFHNNLLRSVNLRVKLGTLADTVDFEQGFLNLIEKHEDSLRNFTISTTGTAPPVPHLYSHANEEENGLEVTHIRRWSGKFGRMLYFQLEVNHLGQHWKEYIDNLKGVRALNMTARNAHWLIFKNIVANNAPNLRLIVLHGLATVIPTGYRVPFDFCLFVKCVKLQLLDVGFLSQGLEKFTSKRSLRLSNYEDAINCEYLPENLRHFRCSHLKIHPVDLLSILQRCVKLESIQLTGWANSHLDFEDTLALIGNLLKTQSVKLRKVVLKESRHFFYKHRALIRKLKQDLKDNLRITLEFQQCDLKMTMDYSRNPPVFAGDPR